MAEVSPGDKVVYGTFVGTVRQLVGDDECVILLRAPMSDGAMTIIAKVKNCEVVTSLPPEAPPEEETVSSPESTSESESVPESSPPVEEATEEVVEEPETVSESTETAEESAPETEESN